MEKRTPNKRKSLASSNTPNKVRKTDTHVSQKVMNKSPKSANKNNQISTNGKNSKSPNKNHNITPKKQVNGNQAIPKTQMNAKQTTPKKQINAKQTTPKRNKKSKQEEIDDSDKYDTNNAIDEMNDSDVEEAEVDEADSDEDAQVDEDESDDEVQVEEDEEAESDEVESDEKAHVDEDESGDEVQVEEDEEAESDEKAHVDEDESGDEVQVEEDEEAESDDEDEVESDENAHVDEDESGDEVQVEEDEEADIDEEENDVGENTNNINTRMRVSAIGFKPHITVDRIFPGCNIRSFIKWNKPGTRGCLENAVVFFKDQESLKKALAKQKVNVDGNIISVDGNKVTKKFGVSVAGLQQETDLQDLFNDCNILWVDVTNFTFRNLFVVYFEDKESMQKALFKSGSEFNGKTITVLPANETEEQVKKLTINITGLNQDAKIEDIFENCNIKYYYFIKSVFGTHQFSGTISVIFEDEESVQKALLKHDTEYNGSVIKLYRINCSAYVKGIKENTKVENILTGCNILSVNLKRNRFTNKLVGAVVHFKDYSSLQKALSMKTPPGIKVFESKYNRGSNKHDNKSAFIKNKFNKTTYQQTHGNVAKKLLLQELKSQVQKLTEEVYGTSKPRPKPFMKSNTFARRY